MDSATGRIRLLPPELANQIAAGEVVERPASVAKELIENSLDAGADEIQVDAEEGGIRLLRVRDNGVGIHRDDLALALSRHATSKLRTSRDLLGIATLGFRGEALASIASVARVSLCSRGAGAESAWSVTGEADAPTPAAHPVGTTIEVRDLFYNTPARRKFLRAERTEYEHLEELIRRLALARFESAFTLRHNGRTIFSVPRAPEPAARERRLQTLLGRPFLEQAAALDFEAAGLRLSGWIGRRGYSRPQADVQYVYLNGRMIRDRVVAHALRQAFADHVEAGRFAAYVLYLTIDPAQVDVNVHPTKHEVRFREARLVHDFLVSAVREALGETARWSGALPERAGEPTAPASVPDSAPCIADSGAPYASAPKQMPRATHGTAAWRVHGVVGERFLVMVSDHRLTLVNGLAQMREEARESLCAQLAGGTLAPRPLLIPVTVRVTPELAAATEVHGERLRRIGLDLSAVSDDVVRIHGLPATDAPVDAGRAAEVVLARCVAGADDATLLDAIVEAVRLPGEGELTALADRAREEFVRELDAEALVRLFQEFP